MQSMLTLKMLIGKNIQHNEYQRTYIKKESLEVTVLFFINRLTKKVLPCKAGEDSGGVKHLFINLHNSLDY